MEFSNFFTELGFDAKQAKIFLTLYKLGNQPASTVAKHARLERTGVYKTLLDMTKRGIVSKTKQKGVVHFFISSPGVIKQYIHKEQQRLDSLEESFQQVEQELVQYESQRYPHLPKITLFDGNEGVKNLFNDIYETVLSNKYLVIKFFASNTFESQTTVPTTLREFSQDIFTRLKKKKVSIDSYLGNGVLIMEQISRVSNIQNLNDLPAGNSSVNIFIVGKILYLIIFKDIPYGIKIDSEEMANVMHFMLEKLELS